MAFAVFFIPMTVLSVPIVDKLKEDRQLTDKNVGKTDSTTVVNFDGHNSISIDFYKKSYDSRCIVLIRGNTKYNYIYYNVSPYNNMGNYKYIFYF